MQTLKTAHAAGSQFLQHNLASDPATGGQARTKSFPDATELAVLCRHEKSSQVRRLGTCLRAGIYSVASENSVCCELPESLDSTLVTTALSDDHANCSVGGSEEQHTKDLLGHRAGTERSRKY